MRIRIVRFIWNIYLKNFNKFKALFPFLNENGGIYVVEDLHTAYWNCCGGTGIVSNGSITDPGTLPGSSINFLKDLVDEVSV